MTKITAHLVIYNERYYDLVRPYNLTHPNDFGLYPPSLASTDNPGGYLCTYVIDKGALFLKSILCHIGVPKPRGWFEKLMSALRKYPPKIQGISPVVDQFRGEVYYDNLAIPLKYAGEIVIGIGDSDNQDLSIAIDRPETFVELLTIALAKGKVITVDRIEGKASFSQPVMQPLVDSSLRDLQKN